MNYQIKTKDLRRACNERGTDKRTISGNDAETAGIPVWGIELDFYIGYIPYILRSTLQITI